MNNLTPKQIVSELIFQVLTEKICVREALERFPKDTEDDSLMCAWHALAHYEADEDMRRLDRDYAEEQDDYLEMMAFLFKEDKPLPLDIIESYKDFYNDNPTQKTYTTFWQNVKRIFKISIF